MWVCVRLKFTFDSLSDWQEFMADRYPEYKKTDKPEIFVSPNSTSLLIVQDFDHYYSRPKVKV